MFIQKMLEHASNSELWSFATVVLIGLITYSLWDYLKSVVLSLQLNGPAPVPILGNCLLLKEKNLMRNRLATAYGLYGSLVRVWVLLFPFFVVLQPDDLQVILSSKKHTNKVFFYRLMHNFLGNGLITSSGHQWRNHRKLIQPMFHLNILEKFIGTFADAAENLHESLTASMHCELNIVKFVNNCVMDVLNEAVLGVPAKKKKTLTVNMEQSPFRQGKVVIPQRFAQPWLLLDSIYHMTKLASDEMDQKNRLNDFTRQMIKIRREKRLNNNIGEDDDSVRKCLLDYMIEISDNDPEFTEDDIVNEACTFMLAGQDSVGAGVAFTLFLLAQNPLCQQKCYEELMQLPYMNAKHAPSMQELRDMRYMEMCIKEALRLYPSVPLLARKLGEDVQLGKYTLPAGSNIFISPYATHRLPQIYPDPEKFDPERFAPKNAEQRHPYAYIPFSAGPRYCIGNRFAIMEMKTIVARVLRSFQLLPVPGKTTVEETFRITLRASGGLWVQLQTRT